MSTSRTVVQKYGGTSVANPKRIREVAKRVTRSVRAGERVVVVVSALGDTTDTLLALATQVTRHPAERELDMLMSTGEQVSVALLAMAIQDLGYEAISFTGAQVGIVTDASHTNAKIIDINADRIRKELRRGRTVIVAGFQGTSLDQDITTLGRGGSDLTAVALAQVLRARVCEIYTDVDGVFTADPRVVPDARKIPYVSYDEMLELASLGAQVLQPRSIELAKKHQIPLHVRSSFSTREGTMISKETRALEEALVTGVTVDRSEAKLTICDVPDKPGVAASIFHGLAKQGINVDMIVQNVGRTGKADVSCTVAESSLSKALSALKDIQRRLGGGRVLSARDIAKVSVVGVGMRSHSGVAAGMFQALASQKINIEMISTSEIKISCIISRKDADRAVKVLHRVFQLQRRPRASAKRTRKKTTSK